MARNSCKIIKCQFEIEFFLVFSRKRLLRHGASEFIFFLVPFLPAAWLNRFGRNQSTWRLAFLISKSFPLMPFGMQMSTALKNSLLLALVLAKTVIAGHTVAADRFPIAARRFGLQTQINRNRKSSNRISGLVAHWVSPENNQTDMIGHNDSRLRHGRQKEHHQRNDSSRTALARLATLSLNSNRLVRLFCVLETSHSALPTPS